MELWVHVSRLPMLHPDKERWKCTMFTNKIYLSVCSCDKILLVYIYVQDETMQHDGIQYNNDNNHINV